MIKRLKIWLIGILILLSYNVYSTHIVGGALTYIHNGGSNYTITLKLYRDCSPGTAGFPNSVSINVLGYNGTAFTPSKNITMPLGTKSSVPSNLDKCAIPPNPMPCTQEAIYTTTVDNLPPVAGGYHLYFQITARNLSLTNVNATCNCIGESFYADIPGLPLHWNEDFSLPNLTTFDNGATAWSITSDAIAPTTANVNNNIFEITGKNNAGLTWQSQSINIASYTDGVNLSVDLAKAGTLDAGDSLLVYYRLNGGPLTLFSTNGITTNNFANKTATANSLIGNTVQIVIRVKYDGSSPASEIYRIDNVLVYGSTFLTNNNSVYDLFPPLFLCAGKPFTFNHAATDTNGDSLFYSFYTPYDGDNSTPLKPVFKDNQAVFQPILWQSGYSATSPLGGSPLNLNSATGMLSGTPGTIGQFVVGVMVKEYRDGKYMSQTLRDFQFNVVSCPEQISAILNPIKICDGTKVNFFNSGGSTGNNWLWNFGDPTTTADTSKLNFPSYTYPTTGNYTVTLITGYKTNCADTAKTVVTVGWVKSGFTHDAPKCEGTSIAFTQTSTNSANINIIESLWNFGDGKTASLVNPTHVYASAGSYTVTLIVTTNSGCSDTTKKIIVIDPKPIVNAGSDQTVCENNALVTLNGSITNATGGSWVSDGTGVFSPNATTLNASYNPSAADITKKSVMLILTSTGNGLCAALKDTMFITISKSSTVAYAGTDQTICGVSTATLSATPPTIGTGKWTIISGSATIANPNSPTTIVSGLSPGMSYTFRWTVSSALCIPSTDDVIINMDLLTTPANAGSDIIICNTTSATLAANTPVVGNGTWTLVSGSATITNPTSPTSTVTNLIAGTTAVLKWTITKGVCNNSDNVTITINKTPTVNAGVDQSFCVATAVKLKGSVQGITTTGEWKTLGTGTFLPNTTTLNATYIPSSADSISGKVTLILTSTNNGVCAFGSDTMYVFFTGFIGTVTTVIKNVSCYGGNDGVAEATVTGGISPYTYFWNTVPTQTSSKASNLTPGTYILTINNGKGCSTSATVLITQPTPLNVNGAITNVSCNGGNDGSIAMLPTGGTPPYTYLCTPGNQTGATITNLGIGTYTVLVTDANGCKHTSTYTITQPTPLSTAFTIANISCKNGSNGIINSVTTGGVAPYTYSWAPNGANAPNISGLGIGTYTLTVTDKVGCSVTSSTLISEPPALMVTIGITNQSCINTSDGEAMANVSGGTPGYTYNWQPGGKSTNAINNLAAGTYTLTVKDLKACASINVITITKPTALAANLINQTNVSCFGGSNGSVTANPSGGTPNYTYLWMPGAISTATINGIKTGTYTVTITDSKNCAIQKTATITEPTMLAVTATIKNATCNGGKNGVITAIPSGGTAPYTYFWQPVNKTTNLINNLAAGTYTVTVTDAKGCKITNSYTVGQPLPISITFNNNNVLCFNGNSGNTTAIISGGTAPYTYSWNTGATTPAISFLKTGTYTLTVTDNAGCTATESTVITQPQALTTSINLANETCNYLNDGKATVLVSGGVPSYSYLWQPGNLVTPIISNLASGSYSVTITDSNGCTTNTSLVINEPNPITIAFKNKINVSCMGGGDGSIMSTITGGTANYTYLWMPGGYTSANLLNISAATYTLTITDKNNCTAQNSVTITEPALPVSMLVSSTPASCFGGSNGSASVTASGGTAPYTYNWMPGNKSGSTITNLTAGTYTVTATDALKCVSVNTVTVSEPAKIIISDTSINANCSSANGKAIAHVSGGLAPYTYSWSPTGGTDSIATGLLSGAYIVKATDMNGCKTLKSINVSDDGTPTPTIFSVVNVTCNGAATGSASVSVTGGLGPFTYSWAPTGGNAAVAVNLTAGSYTVTVVDANGCQSLATTSPDITEPVAIIPQLTTTNVNCFGGSNGSATISATGGSPGYSYVWLPSGIAGNTINNLSASTYSVQIKDLNNCIKIVPFTVKQPQPLTVAANAKSTSCFGGSNGVVTAVAMGGTVPYNYNWMPGNYSGDSISNLTAGTYTVTVVDAMGCSASNAVMVNEPTKVVLVTGSKNSLCGFSNGIAYVSASGGNPSYTYQWMPNGGIKDTAIALLANNYTIKVTDANKCEVTENVTVNNTVGPIATIISSSNGLCNGANNGTATVSVSSGTKPYTYSWAPTGGTGAIGSGLAPGSYTVTVTDSNQCQATAITTTEITEPSELYINTTISNVSCFSGNNGTVTALVSGGTLPYSYKWFPSLTTNATLSNLAAGSYTLQVTDGNSCVKTTVVTITEPSPLASSIISFTNVNCYNETTGSATVAVSGGTPFYNYNWLPAGGNGPDAEGLSAGSYTVSIIDNNGCTTSSTIILTQPSQALTVNGAATNVNCFGGANASATVLVTGGTPAYTYNWSPSGGTGATASGLKAGNYYVEVTDQNGCKTNDAFIITQPQPLFATALITHPSCSVSNGSIITEVNGGTAPYTYVWLPDSLKMPAIYGLAPGVYPLKVTDKKGCTTSLSTTLTNIQGPELSIENLKNVSCFGYNDGSAALLINKGSEPFVITWLPYGGNNLNANNLIAGAYTVRVIDSLGCEASIITTVKQPDPLQLTLLSSKNVSCYNGNDGSATVNATGGTATYSYTWSPIVSNAPSVNNLTVGTYTITTNDKNNCSSSVSVDIKQPMALTATLKNIINNNCYNDTMGSATVSVKGGTLPYDYLWNTIPAQIDTLAINLKAGNISVTITDGKGCILKMDTTITHPKQVITTAGKNDTVCVGKVANLTASASGGAGSYYYLWHPIDSVNFGTLTVSPTVNTKYIVVAYDKNGCLGTSDTVEALVYTLKPENITVTGKSPICKDQSTTIAVKTTGITGALTYQWNNNLGTGTGPYTVTPKEPIIYKVTISNACGSAVSDSIQINFNPPPTLSLSSDTNAICTPNSIQFFDHSVTGNINDPITNWLWDFGDSTTSKEKNPIHNYMHAGTYYVTLNVYTIGGCKNNNGITPLKVDAHPSPTAKFIVNTNDLQLPQEELKCTNKSIGASSYNWNFGDGLTSILENPKHTYPSIGKFYVQLIASTIFGCSDTVGTEIITHADVIFPNVFTPDANGSSGGSYDIKSLSNDVFFPYTSGVTEFKMQIFNRWGELIFESFDIQKGWDGYYRGALCEQGVYIYKAHIKLNNGKVYNKTGDVTLLK